MHDTLPQTRCSLCCQRFQVGEPVDFNVRIMGNTHKAVHSFCAMSVLEVENNIGIWSFWFDQHPAIEARKGTE